MWGCRENNNRPEHFVSIKHSHEEKRLTYVWFNRNLPNIPYEVFAIFFVFERLLGEQAALSLTFSRVYTRPNIERATSKADFIFATAGIALWSVLQQQQQKFDLA